MTIILAKRSPDRALQTPAAPAAAADPTDPTDPTDLTDLTDLTDQFDPTNPTDPTDLAARAARGEPGAFAAIYQRHVEAVFHYFSFRVHDSTVAEDLTHDVFVLALRAIRTLREPHRVAAWLMRIAHNRLANHWRDGASAPEPFGLASELAGDADGHTFGGLPPDGDNHADSTRDPAARLDALSDAARVAEAVAQLTALQQDVIALRFVVGLNVAETADAMGRTVNAVKNLQHQALVRLRRDLAPTPPDPTAVAGPQRARSPR